MASIRDDLESFHQFAAERLAAGEVVESLDELLMSWYDSRSSDDIHEAIRRGLADVDAGRYESADGAMESIRQEFGFSEE
jgi:hypothetical protein